MLTAKQITKVEKMQKSLDNAIKIKSKTKKLTKYEQWRKDMGANIVESDEEFLDAIHKLPQGTIFQHIPALLHCFLVIPKGVQQSYNKFLKQQKKRGNK